MQHGRNRDLRKILIYVIRLSQVFRCVVLFLFVVQEIGLKSRSDNYCIPGVAEYENKRNLFKKNS